MEDVYWECFFNNAGISGPASKDYASVFVKNKISKPILVHINDSHLKSMGIEAIGDIIRILKYIKDFPQTEIVSKSIQEKSERFVEKRPALENCKVVNIQNDKRSTTYERIPGCEVPVATRRVVNPEIEGRYKIIKPTKSIIPTTNPIQNTDRNISQSNRIVILSEPSNTEIDKKSSVLKRLGKSLEKYEKLTNGNADNCDEIEKSVPEIPSKIPKIQIADNKTILKRFFNASLSKDAHTKVSLSKKLPVKNIVQTNKGNVFLRLGNQNVEEDDDNDYNEYEVDDDDDDDDIEESICFNNPDSLPYMGVFKLPNVKRIKSDRVKVRSGHTTESIRKVEATSTTSNFQSIRIDVKAQSIKDRLGRR